MPPLQKFYPVINRPISFELSSNGKYDKIICKFQSKQPPNSISNLNVNFLKKFLGGREGMFPDP